jgi:chromosome segregation ATPase
VLSKKELKSFAEAVRVVIKEEVPPMIKNAIDQAFEWRLPDYVTKKEHERDIYELKRRIASVQDSVIGIDGYIQQEFPLFRRDLDEVKTDVKKLDERMGGLEVGMGGLDGRMGGLDVRMDSLDGRMDGLEGRMDGLDVRMGSLEGRMERLEQKVDILLSR